MLRYLIYCRKSTESEDRQVLSLESQLNELKRLSERQNLSVIDIFIESQSAKSPGRPHFNEMIKRINQNKADGIICWKLDRLARNPIDGGQITWMLQKGIIKHIQTFDRGYFPEDNVLLMNVEFGMANQYILDLGRNVKRGLKTKAEKGWLPALSPLGYLNEKIKERGNNKILKDPDRFDLVKKMWGMMLTGNYTPPKIADIANNDWGFRTPKGKPLIISSIYRLFSNPFYSGWFEYPKGSGNWLKGSHEPMITQGEYDKVQILLGRKGKPRLKKREFAFTGLIRCGECGGMVTAEEKNQIICSNCKHKFSSTNRGDCPKCKTPIEAMESPTILHYVYYHCTKKSKPDCSQGYIEVNELENQIDLYLSNIHISEGFKDWAIKYLKEENEKEAYSRESIFASQRKAYDNCLRKLDNLFQLKISPANTDGCLLSDEEYGKQKTELLKGKTRLEEILNDKNGGFEKWLEKGEKTYNFACHALYWFNHGTLKEKFEILKAIGSNLILRDKKLHIELKVPFTAIGRIVKEVPTARYGFEPDKSSQNEAKMNDLYSNIPIMQSAMNEVRTWIMENHDNFHVPSFDV